MTQTSQAPRLTRKGSIALIEWTQPELRNVACQMEQGSRRAFALTRQISGRELESDFETLLGEAVERFASKQLLKFNFA